MKDLLDASGRPIMGGQGGAARLPRRYWLRIAEAAHEEIKAKVRDGGRRADLEALAVAGLYNGLTSRSERTLGIAVKNYIAWMKAEQSADLHIDKAVIFQWLGSNPSTSLPSAMPPALSNGLSTSGSGGAGRVSWSRTDDSGKP